MKKRLLKNLIHSKTSKRITSAVIAAAMLFGALPMPEIGNKLNETGFFGLSSLFASAEDMLVDNKYRHDNNNEITINITQLGEYSRYAAIYQEYHQNDIINIRVQAGTSSNITIDNFTPLGSKQFPFRGQIKTERTATSLVLNLNAPLFDYVYDSVELNDSKPEYPLTLSRVYPTEVSADDKNTPVLANHVIHEKKDTQDGETSQPVTWYINLTKPSAPSSGATLQGFGGFIGRMWKDYPDADSSSPSAEGSARLNVSVKMNKTGTDTGDIEIRGNADLGLLCGTMDEETKLDFSLETDRKILDIKTAAGNVGGLVGTINKGAELIYKASGNLQTEGKKISTSDANGNAGGIAGYNDRASVIIPDNYVIKQEITGTKSAGGIYGFYKAVLPKAEEGQSQPEKLTVDTSDYDIDCQLAGSGDNGGLFGVLESDINILIDAAKAVVSKYSAGTVSDNTTYGGLVGRFIPNEINNSMVELEVKGTQDVDSVKPDNAGGSKVYGGGIGKIDNAAMTYVKFDTFTVKDAANAGSLTFGGLAAYADNAYIDAKDVTISVNGKYKGGALVGHIDHGVLRLTGTTALTNALPAEPDSDEELYVGQIAGYRDDALIYAAADDWKLERCAAVQVDDIGAWGEVVRVKGNTFEGLFTESGHTVTIASPSTDIATVCDFAKAALSLQIDAENNPYVICEAPLANNADLTLTGDIALAGTGITGLTRDNAVSSSDTKCVYSGTIQSDSTKRKVTLATGEPYGYRNGTTLTTSGNGNGRIYRHSYNGLIGIKDGASVNNIIFDGEIDIKAKKNNMYAGAAAATAKNNFTASGLEVSTKFSYSGDKELTVGGILGEATDDIGNITVSNCTVACDIKGKSSSETVYLGGAVGRIAYTGNDTKNWSFSNIGISGTIENTWGIEYNRYGGLIAAIAPCSETVTGQTNRTLTLSNITVNGLTVSASMTGTGNSAKNTKSLGGLLGYAWDNVNADFNTVSVKNSTLSLSDIDSGSGNMAGLVYEGTGHWTVDSENDVTIDNITVSATGGKSFGMFVNKAWHGKKTDKGSSALYLEIKGTDAYVISNEDDTKLPEFEVFDEFAAYSAYYNEDNGESCVLQNGAAVISIRTSDNKTLHMDNGTTASDSYTAQTSRGNTANPYTRYYYDLDSLSSSGTKPEQLMLWGLRQYAHPSIKSCFALGSSFTSDSEIPNYEYDMEGYSWYPVDIDSDVTVNGTFKFHNIEFEGSEDKAVIDITKHTFDRTSLEYTETVGEETVTRTTQHFLLHNGLFRNVNSNTTLKIGTVTLQGNVGMTEYGSGALICGRVQGEQDKKAVVNVTGSIVLDRVYVHGLTASTSYAPLAINKVGDHSQMNIKAKTLLTYDDDNDICYYSMNDTYFPGLFMDNGNPKAGTSLIGNVGLTDKPVGIILDFSKIILDGRKTGKIVKDSSNNKSNQNDVFTSIYGSNCSIFTKATLLNSFKYDSGSFGKYNFTYADDWTLVGIKPYKYAQHLVTYGKELGYTSPDYDNTTEYAGKELWYSGEPVTGSTVKRYTNPDDKNDTTGWYAENFREDFLPYVATAYNEDNKTHQIQVNQSSADFTGCGTYNDPYIINTGDQLTSVSSILNGKSPGIGFKICIPLNSRSDSTAGETWHNNSKTLNGENGHVTYEYREPSAYTGNTTTQAVDENNQLIYDSNNNPVYEQYTVNYPKGYYRVGYTLPTAEGSPVTEGNDFKSNKSIETHLAGAYFKIGDVEKIEITGNEFKGLGYNGTDNIDYQHAIFRGVFIGDNKEIINKTKSPLIANSNGCVVKDLTLTVECADDITVAGDSKAFVADGTAAYGGLIGKVLGGDNIIDNVLVDYSGYTKQIKADGAKAQLAPIGGYIGVVAYGGVIFRNMATRAVSYATKGLKNRQVTASGSYPSGITATNMLDSDNHAWLYVNPIIGRVINGFAVTEADDYHPFEDGTRTYGDGTMLVWGSDGKVDEYSAEALKAMSDSEKVALKSSGTGVTLHNGTKNWSIADIKDHNTLKAEREAYATANPEKTLVNQLDNSTSATDIKVPNAQAFFVLSLIVNSGMKTRVDNFGYNNVYQISRAADYSDVKTNVALAVGNAPADYNTAKTDSESLAGYIAAKYTTKSANRDMSDKITLTDENGIYYLPDGYKGIGNFYTDSDSLRFNVRNFDGNGATISMNSSFYNYQHKDFDSNNAILSDPAKAGFGLFNCQHSSPTFNNVILQGNVKSDVINKETGLPMTYNSTNYNFENNNAVRALSTGALIGCQDDGTLNLNSVALDNIDIFAPKCAGGLIGNHTPDKKITVINTKAGLNSDKIIVKSGLIAGGLIGRKNQAELDFDFADASGNSCTLNISEVSSLCTSMTQPNKYNYGVGGLIGVCRGNRTKKVTFKNFTLGSENQTTLNNVKTAKANIYTGGFFGILNRSYVDISNCVAYNLSVESQLTAGGIVGHWATASANTNNNKSSIKNIVLKCNLPNAVIKSTGAKLENDVDDTDNMKFCAAGGIIGSAKEDMSDVTINNCEIKGYTISAKVYAGGFAGSWGDDSTTAGDSDGKFNHTLSVTNSLINNCIIDSDSSGGYSGGLLGRLHNRNSGSIKDYEFRFYGYNILAKNLSFNGQYQGYICGHLTNNDKCNIKLAGFSRQDDRSGGNNKMINDLVGDYPTKQEQTKYPYGTNGYVIFADYNDTASGKNANKLFSNVVTSGTNVATMRSVTTKTENDNATVVYGDYDTNAAANTEAGYVSGSTVIKNENYPFVTSNPRQFIDGTQYLTGDAMGKTEFDTTVFNSILGDTSAKKYTNYPELSEAQINDIRTHFSSSHKEFISLSSGIVDFPLLVIEDTVDESITALINNYVRVLTNTDQSFNYAVNVDKVYTVDISKMTYDGEKFVKSDEEVNLEKQNDKFHMKGNSFDTGETPTFTLIDIQFFDPSSTDSTDSKVAYHLYVPVYVKKLLEYNFYASLASNTEYYKENAGYQIKTIGNEKYFNDNKLFENLGNPITLGFEYVYTRSSSEWAAALNSGENVLSDSNFRKSLVINHMNGETWPADTKLVLVDSTRGGKNYYLDYSELPAPSGDVSELHLHDFKSVDDPAVQHTPAPFNDLMTIEVEAGVEGPLIQTDEKTSNSTFEIGGKYYEPKGSVSTGTFYTVKSVTMKPERYYLSIFTKKLPGEGETGYDKNAYEKIYYYGISSKEKFERSDNSNDGNAEIEKDWRPNKIINNAYPYLLIGNLYKNTFDLKVKSYEEKQLMTSTNNYLSFTMTSTIELTDVAIDEDRQIYKVFELSEKEIANISQVFLMTYSMLDNDSPDEQIGIVKDAGQPQEMKCYIKGGKYLSDEMKAKTASSDADAVASNPDLKLDVTDEASFEETANFFEVMSNQNLIGYLANAGHAVTVQTQFDYLYGLSDLIKQFPSRDVSDNLSNVGTKVIGYSNISSSSETAAYSATSEKEDNNVRYYTEGASESAVLTYNMIEQTSVDTTGMTEEEAAKALDELVKARADGKYRSLGVNAITDASGNIYSYADYDISPLSTKGDYIELTLTLSKKSSYVTPSEGSPSQPGDPAAGGAPLKIDDYLTDLKIYGIGDDVLFDQRSVLNGTAAQRDGVTVSVENIEGSSNSSLYRLRVKRELVEKLTEDNDNRYVFRISYGVRTGDGASRDCWNKEYSNYKVSLTASMYTDDTYQKNSYAYDHLIYTNAKIVPNVI